jgi:hypothetical protein
MHSNDQILQNLFSAGGAFAAEAFGAIRPDLAARLFSAPTFVAVATSPPGARLIIQAPDGDDVVCPYQTTTLAPDLGEWAGRAIDAGLLMLSDEAQRGVARAVLAAGARLAVLIDRNAGSVHIVLDAGDKLPHVLATLQPSAPQVTH